jgi:hypothetical protein
MLLSADQLRDFDEQGYLFFPNCFSEEEIALLRDDAEAILRLDRQEVKIVYLTLCAVSNHITKFTRPEWIAHRDFTPIAPVTDDALLAHARSRRVAAE